ncbi:MAG: hypothetical protein BGO30_01630 [Bacteroidetes bacterium 41-46]|nr:MAG: hypothetical protein BGO30_01630 [Bacteroidetes bacterium 41-46]
MKTLLLIVLASMFISCQNNNIKTIINRISVNNNFSGSIIFAINDSIIFNKSYGFSDEKRQIRNSPNTIFPIASITKLFIKQAVLSLADNKKLSLKDSLSMYCQHINFGDSITISDLLYHKSGIPDIHNLIPYFNQPDNLKDKISTKELFDLINSYQKLEFRPGSQVSYSNSNYLILAHVIEEITELPLDVYLRENIFSPYSMLHSGLFKYYSPENGHTAGYTIHNNAVIYVPDFNFMHFWGSGNAFSTTQDLFNYYINSQKNLKSEISSQLIEHSGYYVGFRSYFKVIPEIGMAIIILSNNGDFNNNIIINEIIKYVKEKYLKKKNQFMTNSLLFNGTYCTCKNENCMTIQVRTVEGELTINNQRLFQISKDSFLLDNNSLTSVSFKIRNNNIVELTMNDNGEILIFRKLI